MNLETIMAAVAAEYCVGVADLTGRRRRAREVEPRQAAMFLCRRLAGATYAEIGRAFGRSGETAIWGCRRTRGRMDVDAAFREAVAGMARRMGAEYADILLATRQGRFIGDPRRKGARL